MFLEKCIRLKNSWIFVETERIFEFIRLLALYQLILFTDIYINWVICKTIPLPLPSDHYYYTIIIYNTLNMSA